MAELTEAEREKKAGREPGMYFTTGQSWGALRKAWKGYRIAKTQNDREKMIEYAKKIRKLQTELGVSVADFEHLGLTGKV